MEGFIHAVRHALTRLGVLTSHPFAFGIVGGYALLWLWFLPSTFEWHAVATLSTWFMTLLIQRAEHRDTQAIHAKLDELLSATANARAELSQLDEEEPEEIAGEGRRSREAEHGSSRKPGNRRNPDLSIGVPAPVLRRH